MCSTYSATHCHYTVVMYFKDTVPEEKFGQTASGIFITVFPFKNFC